MAQKAAQQGQYARSELLTAAENQIVERMYAPKREVLAVSVAQLFHASPNPRVWSKQQTGVIALVKDHNQRSYFLHFVNIDTHQTTYSEELYLELDYKTPYSYFHAFPGEKCMVGLNFTSENEAQIFHSAITGITIRNKKRKEKKDTANRPPSSAPQSLAPTPAPAPALDLKPSKADKKGKKDKKDKKGKKKGISKADISGPSNFQHLSHLGWDKDKNQFDESQIHPALKDLLETAGIKTTALKDEGTAEFIKTFVENHGGMDTLVKEKQRRATMRVSANSHGRGPPPAPPSMGHAAPPPPSRSGPPPAPSRHAQPPPPVSRQARGPPPPPSSHGRAPPAPSRGAARAPPAPAAPRAPPAPAAPRAPAAPKAPALGKVAPTAPAPQSGRGSLLDEIRRGKELKAAAAAGEAASGGGGAVEGNDLLAAIRGFGGASKGGLKSADMRQQSVPEPAPDDNLEGMAGALARALAGRNKVLAVDSDESDDESDDDWSD